MNILFNKFYWGGIKHGRVKKGQQQNTVSLRWRIQIPRKQLNKEKKEADLWELGESKLAN